MINKVAILGAGVMGAQIAAHCVNAGIQTLLFDLSESHQDKNALVKKAILHLHQLKPTPLATSKITNFIEACNYDDDLSKLSSCDLVIEAIGERMEWKASLYHRIAPYLHKNVIFVSNTSGLSINVLSETLAQSLRPNFCGLHFFNPPRYMHLVELIPSKNTSNVLLDKLETWLTRCLGKGVIRAKDTPNFIANRVGVFSMLSVMHHALDLGLGFDEVDALTGPLLGRPKSATFRTMDIVGLDTMQHVLFNMQAQLKDDPWSKTFQTPAWLTTLIQEGNLGQKTNAGIYRKLGRTIEVYDISQKTYRAVRGEISDEVKSIMKNPEPSQRLKLLLSSTHVQARFLVAILCDLFHYSAYHLCEIADSVRDVDLAIRWGFGWQEGPFQTWQAIGFQEMKEVLKEAIIVGSTLSRAPLPDWLSAISAFYDASGHAYAPNQKSYLGPSTLPVYQRQISKTISSNIIYENEGVRLSAIKDDISVLSFKTKSNTIGQSVLDGFQQALNKAEQSCQGLIVYQQDASNFSSGADLKGVAELIQTQKMSELSRMVKDFQTLGMRIKYSPIPVVSALRGRALGGGCELMMQSDAVVAAFESYPGLVEVGVGLIPAGGGCKEMALRAAESSEGMLSLPKIRRYFEQIARCVVAESAPDALSRGYLQPRDVWVMNADEVLFVASEKIKMMQASNYHPPMPSQFPVAGREGYATLQMGLVNWLEGGFMTEHDYFLTLQLAHVMCGGDVSEGTLVDEAWILRLEREAFMKLAETPQTKARIESLLLTGKPLRN